ncbi:MAG: hypothetical protein ACLR76_03540 [Alistipes sp.]
MILFFRKDRTVYAVQADAALSAEQTDRLRWLLGDADLLAQQTLDGVFIGPRREMITPWSTNAVEITQNMGLPGIRRIEQFVEAESEDVPFDAMLQRKYRTIDQQVFTISKKPDPIVYIDDMAAYNRQEGLALSDEEIAYLESVSRRIGRKLTDSEVSASRRSTRSTAATRYSTVSSSSTARRASTLFGLIKRDQGASGPRRVGLYGQLRFPAGACRRAVFARGARHVGLLPNRGVRERDLGQAETHNFPTTVEPFNGAATGTGGEIRDRIAGGKGAFPVAGTAFI